MQIDTQPNQTCSEGYTFLFLYVAGVFLCIWGVLTRLDQPHRVSPHSGGLPCTSEFFCWPLRSLTIRMRSQYTPIYYRKSPVPSRELCTILLAHTHNSVCHLLSCPRSSRLRIYYSLISLDHRVTSCTARNGRDNSVCHLLSCLRSSRLRIYYSLISLDHRVTSCTAHKD